MRPSATRRCPWCGDDPIYVRYHDEEWGKAVKSDKILFEFLVLESAQAGLSWITILKRRKGYQNAFAGFDYSKVALFDEAKIEVLAQDKRIIRHRGKIKAAVENARIFLLIQQEFGSFYKYLYSFMPNGKRIVNVVKETTSVPTRSPESDAISKDLKKRGMKFFGTTLCYAYMQAVGMVDDHLDSCSFKRI